MHMLALILFVFFITYLPGFVIKVVVDRCYKHPTLHAISYVFNWASVWINPIIYISAQKKYQVTFIVGGNQDPSPRMQLETYRMFLVSTQKKNKGGG